MEEKSLSSVEAPAISSMDDKPDPKPSNLGFIAGTLTEQLLSCR